MDERDVDSEPRVWAYHAITPHHDRRHPPIVTIFRIAELLQVAVMS